MNSPRIVVTVAAVALAVLAGQSLGGSIRHDVDPQAYLDLGANSAYSSVGHIAFQDATGGYLASGTLIADNWVLTAGHVVAGTTSMDFTIGGQTISGTQFIPHPKWNGDLLTGYDIGLVKLASSVSGVAPATLYTGSNELGNNSVAVGYGLTGTGLTGATTYDGQKRGGENALDAFYRSHPRKAPRIILTDFDNPLNAGDNQYGSAIPLGLEYLIAPGDSGGGLFFDIPGDGLGPLLAGVHSFIGSFDGETNADYGDIAGHIRVSQFGNWISDIISGGGGGGGGRGGGNGGGGNGGGRGRPGAYDYSSVQYLDPANLVTVPEPASMTLLAMGAIGVLARRRRR